MKCLRILLFLPLFAGLLSCSTKISGYIVPGEKLDRNSVYVIEKNKVDKQRLYEVIHNQLSSMGLTVYLSDNAPERIKANTKIKYGAQWQWDINWYLLDLSIKFYDVNNGFLIASAQSSRSSLVRKDKSSMVREALNQIFTNHKL